MAKIKKLKEIKSKIKLIEKTNNKNHLEDSELEEEIQEEDSTNFSQFINRPRNLENIDPSLEQEEIQEGVRIIRSASQTDDDEVTNRPSYVESGSNPYQDQNYQSSNSYDSPTPNISGERIRDPINSQSNSLRQAERKTDSNSQGISGELTFERDYAGKESESQEKSKRRRMF
jgi:hypothetical protein